MLVETECSRLGDSVAPRGDAELAVDRPDVAVDGVLRDEELVADLVLREREAQPPAAGSGHASSALPRATSDIPTATWISALISASPCCRPILADCSASRVCWSIRPRSNRSNRRTAVLDYAPAHGIGNDEPAHDELPLIKWAARLLPRDLRGPTQSVSGSQHEVVRGFGQSKRRPCNEVVSLPCHQCFRRALDLKPAFGRQRPLQSRAQFRRQSRRTAQRAHFHPLWVTVVCPVLNETSSIGIRVDSRG